LATNHGALPGELAGRSAIFADGAPAPLMTSLAHDMTLAIDASFNGAIFLTTAAVDRALKESMEGERVNKSFGREVSEKEMS
jgi:hypothetical protein